MTSLPSRLLRPTFPALCLMFASVCVGTTWLWWRSYHAPLADWVWWNSDEPGGQALRSLSFRSGHGGFQIETTGCAQAAEGRYRSISPGSGSARGLNWLTPSSASCRNGRSGLRKFGTNLSAAGTSAGPIYGARRGRCTSTPTGRRTARISTPGRRLCRTGYPASAFAVPPLLWLALRSAAGLGSPRARLAGSAFACGAATT